MCAGARDPLPRCVVHDAPGEDAPVEDAQRHHERQQREQRQHTAARHPAARCPHHPSKRVEPPALRHGRVLTRRTGESERAVRIDRRPSCEFAVLGARWIGPWSGRIGRARMGGGSQPVPRSVPSCPAVVRLRRHGGPGATGRPCSSAGPTLRAVGTAAARMGAARGQRRGLRPSTTRGWSGRLPPSRRRRLSARRTRSRLQPTRPRPRGNPHRCWSMSGGFGANARGASRRADIDPVALQAPTASAMAAPLATQGIAPMWSTSLLPLSSATPSLTAQTRHEGRRRGFGTRARPRGSLPARRPLLASWPTLTRGTQTCRSSCGGCPGRMLRVLPRSP